MWITFLCAVSLRDLMHNIMMILSPSLHVLPTLNKEKRILSLGTWSGGLTGFYMRPDFIWPSHLHMSTSYASGAVFALSCLFPSSLNLFFPFPVPLCRLGLHCSDQMAFCLAELHLWSTQSSLKVKGNTYHHVQSAHSLNYSFSGSSCHHSLCFHSLSSPQLYLH